MQSSTIKAENFLFCVTFVETWEKLSRINKELFWQKTGIVDTARFVLFIFIGTALMTSVKLRFFGWAAYVAAILFLFLFPFMRLYNLRRAFRSANKNGDIEWFFSFFKDSFSVVSLNSSVTRKYSDLYMILVGDEYIYLFPKRNLALPVPRDHGDRDKFLLNLMRPREKVLLAPIICCLFVVSGFLTAFFGITQVRLPHQWLLQTWALVICAAMPIFWMITTFLAAFFQNLYRISYIKRAYVRFARRVFSYLLCGIIILGLALIEIILFLGRYTVTRNVNGTYTEHVDDNYAPEEYRLYRVEGPFFLKYLRPMSDATDTDPSISEADWFASWRSSTDKCSNPGSIKQELGRAGGQSERDSQAEGAKSKQIREGALKIINEWSKDAKGEKDSNASSIREKYTTKGDPYFVLYESDEVVICLQYDRDSQNGRCGLYVLYRCSKSSDGMWSLSEAQIENMYAYEYSTGGVVASGKTDWAGSGSEKFQKLTGEP